MGTQFDMIDQMYEKENKELLVARTIERNYKNLSYVRDIIAATSLRYKEGKGAFTVAKKLANASEQIHYAIFHMCTFLYYETRHLKEYSGATPMSLLDDVEERINAGLIHGKPLIDVIESWDNASRSCRNAIIVAMKNLQNHKSMEAAEAFVKSSRDIAKELKEAFTINEKDHALQGSSQQRYF